MLRGATDIEREAENQLLDGEYETAGKLSGGNLREVLHHLAGALRGDS